MLKSYKYHCPIYQNWLPMLPNTKETKITRVFKRQIKQVKFKQFRERKYLHQLDHHQIVTKTHGF